MVRGFSFSWRRALGLSAAKARLSRRIGIPLTHSGRERKLSACTLYSSRLDLMNSYVERTRPALSCVNIAIAPATTRILAQLLSTKSWELHYGSMALLPGAAITATDSGGKVGGQIYVVSGRVANDEEPPRPMAMNLGGV